MNKLILCASVAGLMMSGSVLAADAAAGKAKSAACVACHAADGNSTMPIYPKLAGQHEAYLASAIKAYRDGQRTGGNAAIMAPMAKGLSDADVANLAAYYSKQKAK